MTTDDKPDPVQLHEVERSLYNRMVKNAFLGFFKSAFIGAAIGLVLGGIAVAAVSAGMIPASPLIEGSLHGALKIAAWFAGVAGSFGAVAGIQSTRDTRRFFLMHEGHQRSPEHTTERALMINRDAPEMNASRGDFRARVQGESPSPEMLQR